MIHAEYIRLEDDDEELSRTWLCPHLTGLCRTSVSAARCSAAVAITCWSVFLLGLESTSIVGSRRGERLPPAIAYALSMLTFPIRSAYLGGIVLLGRFR